MKISSVALGWSAFLASLFFITVTNAQGSRETNPNSNESRKDRFKIPVAPETPVEDLYRRGAIDSQGEAFAIRVTAGKIGDSNVVQPWVITSLNEARKGQNETRSQTVTFGPTYHHVGDETECRASLSPERGRADGDQLQVSRVETREWELISPSNTTPPSYSVGDNTRERCELRQVFRADFKKRPELTGDPRILVECRSFSRSIPRQELANRLIPSEEIEERCSSSAQMSSSGLYQTAAEERRQGARQNIDRAQCISELRSQILRRNCDQLGQRLKNSDITSIFGNQVRNPPEFQVEQFKILSEGLFVAPVYNFDDAYRLRQVVERKQTGVAKKESIQSRQPASSK